MDDFLNDFATGPEKTQAYFRDQLRPFRAYLNEAEITAVQGVDATMLRAYLAREADKRRRPRPLSPKSVHHRYLVVHRFFAWCVEQRFLARNPATDVRPPKLPHRIRVGYTSDELRRLLRYVHHPRAKRSWIGVRNRAILILFLDTGARASELLGLTLGDVDLREKRVLLHGKGGKDRFMPLGTKALDALRQYLEVRPLVPFDAFWINLFGEVLTYDALRDMLCDLERYASVENVEAHRLRHTYACAHYEKNRDLIALQHALDHSEPETTVRYLKGLGVSFHMRARYPSPGDWLVVE